MFRHNQRVASASPGADVINTMPKPAMNITRVSATAMRIPPAPKATQPQVRQSLLKDIRVLPLPDYRCAGITRVSLGGLPNQTVAAALADLEQASWAKVRTEGRPRPAELPSDRRQRRPSKASGRQVSISTGTTTTPCANYRASVESQSQNSDATEDAVATATSVAADPAFPGGGDSSSIPQGRFACLRVSQVTCSPVPPQLCLRE